MILDKLKYKNFIEALHERQYELCVQIKAGEVRKFNIEKRNHGEQHILRDGYSCGELAQAGDDYFAVFKAGGHNITYIFQEDGCGFRLGPDTKQVEFFWQLLPKSTSLKN